jgi:hypothetical protein
MNTVVKIAVKQPERCPLCKQVIRRRRSPKISTHFHAHITQIARETGFDRDYVYQLVLLQACQMETEGGSPYPYTIVNDVLYPKRTSGRTNKQMMTAVEAAHLFGAQMGVELNEKPEQWLEEFEE